MAIERTFGGNFSNEEVFAWIDETIRANSELKAKQIRVSKSLADRGIVGDRNGVPMDGDMRLYPDDQVHIIFDDE